MGPNRRAQERKAAARAAAKAKRAEAERKAIVDAHRIAEWLEAGALLGEKGFLGRRVDSTKHCIAMRGRTEAADRVAVAICNVDRLGAQPVNSNRSLAPQQQRSSARRQGALSRYCLQIVAHNRGRSGARRATSLKPARANVEAVPTKMFDELFGGLVSMG
jgi:hypothetical protein